MIPEPLSPAPGPSRPTPAGRTAWWLGRLLIGGALVAALGVITEIDQIRLLDGLESGSINPLRDSDRLQSSDDRAVFAHGLALLLFLVTAVVWLVWFNRLYRDLHDAGGRPLRHGPRWAVLAWIVPILNLFRPKQMVNDTWSATSRDPGEGESRPPVLNWWWGTLMVSTVLARVAVGSESSAETLDDLRRGAVTVLVADFLDIGACVLAYQVVARLTARYESWRATAGPVGGGGRPA